MGLNILANRTLATVCLTAGLLFSAHANAGAVIAAFDFENEAAGSLTANASATGAGITGAVFGGTKGDSRVLTFADNTYTSAALFPNANGTALNFFSFTTSSSLDLGALSFEAGHNDIPNVSRNFEVRLSPEGTSAPTGNFGPATAGWTLLSTLSMPFGFANSGTPNFSLDLTGITLGPGTYQVAFGAQAGNINIGTTQLFMDDVILTAADVPEPGMLAVFGLGLVGLGLARRRKAAA